MNSLETAWKDQFVPHTIVVLGISGVGKSHLARGIVGRDRRFVHVQASELLKTAMAARSATPVQSETLRGGAVVDNQALLLEAFAVRRATEERHILFDGHNLIDTPGGLVVIPSAVFEGLNPLGIVLVQDDPERVVARRAADASRIRPSRSATELDGHQAKVEVLATEVAERIGVPMVKVRSGADAAFEQAVLTLCGETADAGSTLSGSVVSTES